MAASLHAASKHLPSESSGGGKGGGDILFLKVRIDSLGSWQLSLIILPDSPFEDMSFSLEDVTAATSPLSLQRAILQCKQAPASPDIDYGSAYVGLWYSENLKMPVFSVHC